MKNIDLEEVKKEFNRLLKIVDEAKKTDDPDKIRTAATESLLFISKLSGNEIAKSLIQKAQHPLPEIQYIKSRKPPQIDSSSYVKRGLARLVLTLHDVLDAARMSPEVLTRDLREMSLANGASPVFLSSPKKMKGQKDNRDVKYAAKKRIAYIVYHEAGRKRQNVKATFHELNHTSARSMESDTKTWDRIAALLSPDERENASTRGQASTLPHPDVAKFRDLMNKAMM
jgi:hypothetical protein